MYSRTRKNFDRQRRGAQGTTRHSSVPPVGAPKLKQTQTIPVLAAPWSRCLTTETLIRVEIPYRTTKALTPDSLVLSSGSLLADDTDSRQTRVLCKQSQAHAKSSRSSMQGTHRPDQASKGWTFRSHRRGGRTPTGLRLKAMFLSRFRALLAGQVTGLVLSCSALLSSVGSEF